MNRDPRVTNHDQHIKWLLNAVKQLQKDREVQAAEIDRLRRRVERMDSE